MNFPIITITLGVIAGLMQIAGYIYYVKKINVGRVKPNSASWSIWALSALLESSTYVFITGDFVKNILPIACALSAVMIFIYCVHYGHFKKPTNFEWSIVGLNCVAIFIWWWYQSALYAHFFLIFVLIIGYIPLILHAWNDPMTEDATPWYIWAFAYGLLILVVIFRWEKWQDLVYPLASLSLSVFVAILALDNRVPKTLKFHQHKLV